VRFVIRATGFVLAILALSAWLLRTAILADFNELGLLLVGGLSFAFLLAIRWDTKRLAVKIAVVVSLLPMIFLSGLGVQAYGKYLMRYRDAEARTILANVAHRLQDFRERKGAIPDCPYACMVEELNEGGSPAEILLPCMTGQAPVRMAKIPTKDGWNCRYFYRKLADDSFILRSSGPDRRFGTDDDITLMSSLSSVQETVALPMWRGFLREIPAGL
jgi:hypothetical protein